MNIVVFRVDSSFDIGAGHLSRCLNLALSLRNLGRYPVFVSRQLEGNLLSKVRPNFPCFIIQEDSPDSSDDYQVRDASGFISSLPIGFLQYITAVIVDHYQLDSIWENIIQAYFAEHGSSDISFMTIDDYYDRPHSFPILLNQTFSSSLFNDYSNVPVAGFTSAFYGSHFGLLSSEYCTHSLQITKPTKSVQSSILISFGGSDRFGVTLMVLKLLLSSKYITSTIYVVVGPQNRFFAEIITLTQAFNSIFVYHDLPSLQPLISICDVAIAAPGFSALERACLDLPSLLIHTAENQFMSADYLHRSNISIHLGHYSVVSTAQITHALDQLLSGSTTLISGKAVTDGFGGSRLAYFLSDSIPNLQIRSASPADVFILWRWANDFNVRMNSFSSSFIPLASHISWFNKTISSNSSSIFIISDSSGCPLGQIRFDLLDNSCFSIDLSLDICLRGMGLSYSVLELGVSIMRLQNLHSTFQAEVLTSNIPSLRLFAAFGFRPISNTNSQITFQFP